MTAPPCCVTLPRHALHCAISSSSSSSSGVQGLDVSRQLRLRSLSLSSHGSSAAAAAARVRRFSGCQHGKRMQRSEERLVRPKNAAPRAALEPLKTVTVEDDDVSLEGVAKVERERPVNTSSWGRIALLAGGDVVAILIFAAVGRLSHGLSALDWNVVETADPFIAGWLLGAYLCGGFGPEGQGLKGLPSATVAAAKSWVVGIPLGLAIRAFGTGHIPPQPFVLVSLASTIVLLIGWRSAFTAAFPTDDSSLKSRQGDRQGSVFELFELLTSLVRRW
ncbi:hypothetical protein O6H91_10G078200 [Diphasiastrum complanatum]|uniref:Uncharacterized protein n=2 Tax=Diphasiastrum complanatum TaxID=34168 RepID=A0ACC2CII7_DIPCM|nr:hypothetical protein O6H91_10G078200 [Diphasiastrum complanatum]KAJ7541819.1 hypothetical protein O6H91_10G078200 [Diphasiastrum complanatum]